MKKRTILLTLLLGSILLCSCGKKEETPELSVASETSTGSLSAEDTSFEDGSTSNDATSVSEEEEAVHLNTTNTSQTSAYLDIEEQKEAGLIDEEGNVAPTDDNNVLPSDIDPEDYEVSGTSDMETTVEGNMSSDPASGIAGQIDYTELSLIFHSMSGWGEDAGSTLKEAGSAAEIMTYANQLDAGSMDENVLSAAMLSVLTGYQNEMIADIKANASAVQSAGERILQGEEDAILSSAGVLEQVQSARANGNTTANWNAFWQAYAMAEGSL